MRARLEPSDLLTMAALTRPLVEVLDEPVTALLGVSTQVATALAEIGVVSVFDLAMSRVFAAAVQLDDAADNAANALNRFGSAPSDLVNADFLGATRITDLRFEKLEVLAGIPDPAALQAALGVLTVRDLSVYPPFRAATAILQAAFFPEQDGGFDPEAPADLIPRSGEYPTERVQYTTLVLDKILRADSSPPLIDVASPSFSPIDVAPAAGPDFGFTTLGLGALLTINQSWFMQGVTLGHLLHSMALAPGESTRIAVVDWSRRTSAGQTELVGENEDVAQDTSRNRSISEVTQAVAHEAQTGFSSTESESTTKQAGASVGLSIGPVGFGGSASWAKTKASAESYATTAGSREVGASMLQQATDRTQQAAHASRTRRASVVREVSQSEHEQVSTRVVTNYNHMHALSVQYYEVLQVYRTETSLVGCDRVVFVPFKLIDFSNEDVLKRFRAALVDAALTTAVRDALINYETLEIVPERKVRFPDLGGTLEEIVLVAGMARPAALTPGRSGLGRPPEPSSVRDGGEPSNQPAPERPEPVVPDLPDVTRALWSESGRRATSILGSPALRRGSESFFLPADVRIVDGRVESSAGDAITLTYHRADGSSITDLTLSIALAEISTISLAGSSTTAAVQATATLTLARNGVIFPFELPTVTVQMGAPETRIVRIHAASADVNLVEHLNGNQLYYSQAAFRALDAAMIAGLLSPFAIEIDGRSFPLVQVAEPTPLRIVGNALAFKINTDLSHDTEWQTFMAERGLEVGEAKVDLVPLSSGGVFAEAVLGRFNSAEKLDMTRFWDWQDSPIPIQASEIAAIQMGSRAAAEDLKAGPLSAPIVNITPPAVLPDPTGMTGALAAIQNGGMFRDMSGLAETVKLASEAIKASSAGATAVGAQASKNMEVAVTADTERRRIAAQLVAALAGKSLGDKNNSTVGAITNEVAKQTGAGDGAGGGAGSKGTAAPGAQSGSGSTGSAPGGSGSGPGKAPVGAANTREGPPASTGNVALDNLVGNDALVRRYIGMSEDSPEPTAAVTSEGVPLLEWDVYGGNYSLLFQARGEQEPQVASQAQIELLVNEGWWKPTTPRDFQSLMLGDEQRHANSFGSVVLPISMMPAGSLKALNIVAHATGANRLAFAEAFLYDEAIGDLATEHIAESVPLSTMDFNELLGLVGGAPVDANGTRVQVADVRRAFPVEGEVRVFNLSNPLWPEYIQALANYFQVRTTGFISKPVLVVPEVLAQTDPFSETVLSSKVSVGFLGDPAADVTVDFFTQLLSLDRSVTGAYTAFPRR